MKTLLGKGLTKDQQEELTRDFKSVPRLRKAMVNALEDKIEAERNEMEGKASLSSVNWNLKQVNSLGYIRSMKNFITLLT